MPSKILHIPLLAEAHNNTQFAIFPGESNPGVILSQEEVLELSHIYSNLYEIYISRLSVKLVEEFGLTKSVASILVRRALVPLLHCFLDRLIRVKKAIDIVPGQLTIPKQALFPSLDTVEEFQQCAVDNPVFNQSITGFIGGIWQLPKSESVPDRPIYKSQVDFKNNLSQLYKRTFSVIIKKILLRFLNRLPLSRFPALTMANAQETLIDHGFYTRFFEDVSPKWELDAKPKNIIFRKKLLSKKFVDSKELNDFFNLNGLNESEKNNAIVLLSEFLQIYYPSTLLESISNNLSHALYSLQGFENKKVLMTSGRCTRSEYVIAAAKQKGFFVVDYQHGGHYGYFEDVSVINELEYYGIDQFVSWGWTKLSKSIPNKKMLVTPLPSPWLTGRKRYWRRLDVNRSKQYDILLMPNMVKRFTGAPQGASSSRIDLIKEMSSFLLSIVRQSSENGVNLLHKPYNTTTIGLLRNTLKEMKVIGGSLYSCEKQLDKGLTYELLQRCHVVVWDQPGTGFLECLSSGIPTMIYWPRTYCREEKWVQADFKELEFNGVVHRDVSSLVGEILKFKQSPELWMKNQERILVINRFCHKFAWVSDDWPNQWKSYLKKLG